NRIAKDEFADVEKVLETIRTDLKKHGASSKYAGKTEQEQIEIHQGADGGVDQLKKRLAKYRAYTKSRDHIAAVADAEAQGERAKELAARGIPPTGALSQMRSDPKTQGPRLFRQHCASCHSHADADGNGIVADEPSAPNLYGFASRKWLTDFMNPDKIKTHEFFGGTKHVDGEMVTFVEDELTDPSEEDQKKLAQAIIALSAEAQLLSQQEADEKAKEDDTIEAGLEVMRDHSFNESQICADCHLVPGGDDPDYGAPVLVGYGSRQWLIDFISNPNKPQFYGDNNDRMPAFAEHGINRAPSSRDEALSDVAATKNRIPSRRDLELIVDWIRGDWYEPLAKETAAP
ncbi:MAG: hypothetical protein MI757_14845, partial [Pirellulales bacterium]|nr:hypothetical protein [Pirellulales bacterium]